MRGSAWSAAGRQKGHRAHGQHRAMCGMSLADTAEVFLAPTRVPRRHDVPPTLTSIDKETVEKSLHRELIFRPVSPDDTVVRGGCLASNSSDL